MLSIYIYIRIYYKYDKNRSMRHRVLSSFSLPLALSRSVSFSLSLSLTHSLTHTHTLSLSLARSLSLSPSSLDLSPSSLARTSGHIWRARMPATELLWQYGRASRSHVGATHAPPRPQTGLSGGHAPPHASVSWIASANDPISSPLYLRARESEIIITESF